ncbi:MAG: exodeoxyribonuclease VII large subunit [Clostridia bacterium]|nr:exodeoxyribonuclease VII large subunit [Clostridia bacterium]
MYGNILNVTTLNNYINSIFRAEELLHDISVAGEISGFKITKGHAYFTLKDENCQIACNCFNCAKTYIPKDGESVILKGSVDYYSKGGRLNFNVDSITSIGKGLLAYKLELLKVKLAKEGLFDTAYKKAIPPYPTDVCVITSASGAVINDIKKTVRRKNDIINIYVKDVKVQGLDAHKDIIKALEVVDEMNFDVIIIARGGGSAEDLMPFNEEELVRAIFRCKTPIISAVGHESDVTLCDEVADYRSATPTAAAEKIAYDTQELKEHILYCGKRMKSTLLNDIALKAKDLNGKVNSIKSQVKLNYIQNANIINSYIQNLKIQIDKTISKSEGKYTSVLSRLTADNPLGILQKGYWYVSKDGQAVLSAKFLQQGDTVSLKTHDGQLNATITEVEQ